MVWRLELEGISKRYPGVVANDAVSLRVAPGQIHAVLGENGAGKSTLMKIIFGAVQPDAGSIRFDGEAVLMRNPHAARALGVAMVFQHFSLFDTLSVAENVWLGLGKDVKLAEVTRRIRDVAAGYGLDIAPERPVHTLSVGERQRVEIIRALLTDPKLLILDEPTSVLAPQAVHKLFDTLRKLAATGCSILYISHKLDEIRALCHHCTVMRAGKVVAEVDPAQESNASLSRLMIGADIALPTRRPAQPGAVALELAGLNQPAADPYGVALQDLSLQLRAGEMLGIAGVSGNGQQELLAVLSGEDARTPRGALALFGKPLAGTSPGQRRRAGLRVVPEERLGRGAVPALDLAANTLLTHTGADTVRHGWLRWGAVSARAQAIITRFGVRAAGPQAAAQSLSGGNLQKFIVGREITGAPRVLVVAQPTWGVDVGAAAQIRGELLALRDAGCALLVISEDLDELFEICDRIAVIARGRLSPALPIAEATVERIGQWMSGLWDAAAPPPDLPRGVGEEETVFGRADAASAAMPGANAAPGSFPAGGEGRDGERGTACERSQHAQA
ncbi:MAG: ABC transporter ATP-binding protein [Thiomonas sp.]